MRKEKRKLPNIDSCCTERISSVRSLLSDSKARKTETNTPKQYSACYVQFELVDYPIADWQGSDFSN